MKSFLFILSVLGILGLTRGENNVESGVYSFSKAKVEKTKTGEERLLINGPTTHLKDMEISAITLNPGKTILESNKRSNYEELIIVKDGELKITLNNESKNVGPGSVALILPENKCDLENGSSSQATYYIIKYISKLPVNMARGKTAGGSVLYDWDEIQFSPHDKGGIRNYFDRKSSMSDRIEMHVTTLFPQIKSHDPHTHEPAEIVIMMEGNTEMEIDNKLYQGSLGDIYFLGSNILHGIRNTGDKACMYMAFQWQ